jgi:hypothetical protein
MDERYQQSLAARKLSQQQEEYIDYPFSVVFGNFVHFTVHFFERFLRVLNKSLYKTTFTTPVLICETNLMRHLTMSLFG